MAEADLSNMEGCGMLYHPDTRRGSLPPKTRVFFPQPDWKPFSMRWPYLGSLILLFLALAVMQEVLYRSFGDAPMVSFRSPDELGPWTYFAVKFAPSICAVLYGVLWQFTDFEVRRLEAFYWLSRDGGALAAESINVDYVTGFDALRPLRALQRRHWAVALSSVATALAASPVPTCAAASIVLSPTRRERAADPDAEKLLRLSAVWCRLLTTTLVLCAAAGCAPCACWPTCVASPGWPRWPSRATSSWTSRTWTRPSTAISTTGSSATATCCATRRSRPTTRIRGRRARRTARAGRTCRRTRTRSCCDRRGGCCCSSGRWR